MSRSKLLSLVFIAALLFMVSCSGGDSNIIAPPSPEKEAVAIADEATTLLGFYQVIIDKATHNVDIVNMRDANLAINVLGFLEPPPLVGMTIDFDTLFLDEVNNIIEVDVILSHPIPDPVFMGFDVRGVVFGPVITNSDGLTVIPSPEFFTGEAFGYMDGLLGAPGAGGFTGLAGYKYFADGLGLNDDLATFFSNQANVDDRGVFSDGSVLSRHYVLDWTDSAQNFFVFNYAIYANYDWPIGDPPISIDSFNVTTANSAEAFCLNVTETNNSLYYADGFGGGGRISLEVEAWDWLGNISNVTLESADGVIVPLAGFDTGPAAGSTSASYLYEFNDVAGVPTATGDLELIITVTDSVTFGDAWFMGLLSPGNSLYAEKVYNSFSHMTTVMDCPPATVNSIDPTGGWAGQTIDDATIDGTFLDGASLAVRLEMTGETNIDATDVNFVDSSTITCDFDLTGATSGDWDIIVTNGCGVEGELLAGFEVKSCSTLTCPSGSPTTMIGGNRLYYWPPQPVQVANSRIIAAYYSYRFTTINVTGTSYYDSAYNSPTYSVYETCITSDDRLYYQDSGGSNRVYYTEYGPPFSSMRTSWGIALPSGRYVWRLAIDADDNPIVLARYGMTCEIYHWNGSDWGTAIPVPGSDYGNYYYYINDFAYDPSTGYYYIVDRSGYAGVHAYDSSGTMVWEDDQVFGTTAVNGSIWEPGIFIDVSDPDCRLILMAGRNSYYYTTYWARFNNVGGGKTTGTTSGGTYGSTFSTFQGEGCVQTSGGVSRFMASTYGGNVWSSTIVPNW